MKLKIITCIAVENCGKFLILKRSPNETMPGLWEFPSGKLEIGESLESCAKRELLEEAGLESKSMMYLGYSERFKEDKNLSIGVHTIVHHFYTDDFMGNVKLSKEHCEFKWVGQNEIFTLENVGTDSKECIKLLISK